MLIKDTKFIESAIVCSGALGMLKIVKAIIDAHIERFHEPHFAEMGEAGTASAVPEAERNLLRNLLVFAEAQHEAMFNEMRSILPELKGKEFTFQCVEEDDKVIGVEVTIIDE